MLATNLLYQYQLLLHLQLVQLLVQTAPAGYAPTAPQPAEREHLPGPVVDPKNTPDVVTDQSQVDDLLASLGF